MIIDLHTFYETLDQNGSPQVLQKLAQASFRAVILNKTQALTLLLLILCLHVNTVRVPEQFQLSFSLRSFKFEVGFYLQL